LIVASILNFLFSNVVLIYNNYLYCQHDACLSDLEQCQGELAAAKFQSSLAESDLVKTKGQNEQLESELKQSKVKQDFAYISGV